MNIFVINLKERLDRKEYIVNELDYHKLSYTIVEGINGWKLDRKDYNIKKIGTKGALGCFLSHQICLEKVLCNKAPYGIIMEDDIEIITPEFMEDTKNLIKELPEDWDICYLGSTEVWKKKWSYKVASVEPINQSCSRLKGHHYGTGAYIIRKRAIKKLKFYPIPCAIDIAFNYWGLVQYIATPNLVQQKASWGSDTQTTIK